MNRLLDTNLYPMKIISFTQSFKFCSYITLHNDIFHFIFSQSIYIKIFRNKFQLYKNMLIMILMPNVESQFPHWLQKRYNLYYLTTTVTVTYGTHSSLNVEIFTNFVSRFSRIVSEGRVTTNWAMRRQDVWCTVCTQRRGRNFSERFWTIKRSVNIKIYFPPWESATDLLKRGRLRKNLLHGEDSVNGLLYRGGSMATFVVNKYPPYISWVFLIKCAP